jgi:hypothetical protein
LNGIFRERTVRKYPKSWIPEEHQKVFMIIVECLEKNKIVYPSETLYLLAHKSLIGFLSLVFRENKKGLDLSVFTFCEKY